MASLEWYSPPLKSCSPVFAVITRALERSIKYSVTVKPLYSEQSRDPIFFHYTGVHLRGVRYVHVHMCLQCNVHIKTVPSLLVLVRDLSGGRAIFHDRFPFFIIFLFFLYRYMYIS